MKHLPLIAIFVYLVFAAFASVGASPYVSEKQTTYRAGDVVPYVSGCYEAEDVLNVATTEEVKAANALFMEKVKAGDCFLIRDGRGRLSPIPVQLKAWIAGPLDNGDGGPISVWRGIDSDGDEIYLPLPDSTGPHEPLSAI